MRVYVYYVRTMGVFVFSSCLFFYSLFQVCSTGSSAWLSDWADTSAKGNVTTADRDLYLGVYGALGAAQVK